MTHTISVYYFPKGIRYTTPVLIAASFYLWYEGLRVWGVILVLVTIFILTAKYITRIDLDGKRLSDAFGFFGTNIVNERTKFDQLNKIVITKGNYSQTINTRAQSRQFDWTDYTGTLIYDTTGSLDLITSDDKDQLLNDLKIYASSLNVHIEDVNGRLIFSPS